MCSLSPKQKAEELVLIYLRACDNKEGWFNTSLAKKAALITVDEMITQCEDANFGGFSLYWESVKQELLNLQNNV